MPIPNLDLMGVEQLYAFAEKHDGGKNFKDLIPAIDKRTITDTKNLAAIAWYKAGVKLFKAEGAPGRDYAHFLSLIEMHYSQLSPRAQWRTRGPSQS